MDEEVLWQKTLSIDNTSLPLVRPGSSVKTTEEGKEDVIAVKLDYDITPSSMWVCMNRLFYISRLVQGDRSHHTASNTRQTTQSNSNW